MPDPTPSRPAGARTHGKYLLVLAIVAALTLSTIVWRTTTSQATDAAAPASSVRVVNQAAVREELKARADARAHTSWATHAASGALEASAGKVDEQLRTDLSDTLAALTALPETSQEIPGALYRTTVTTAYVVGASARWQAQQDAAAAQAEAERLAAEQAEAERLAAEQAEADRLAAEQAEAERLAAEQAAAEKAAARNAAPPAPAGEPAAPAPAGPSIYEVGEAALRELPGNGGVTLSWDDPGLSGHLGGVWQGNTSTILVNASKLAGQPSKTKDVIRHEMAHIYTGRLMASTGMSWADLDNAMSGAFGSNGTEKVADCVAIRFGASWTNYTKNCSSAEQQSWVDALIGGYLP